MCHLWKKNFPYIGTQVMSQLCNYTLFIYAGNITFFSKKVTKRRKEIRDFFYERRNIIEILPLALKTVSFPLKRLNSGEISVYRGGEYKYDCPVLSQF
jgi:hypothetical protein